MAHEHLLIHCTCPDEATAAKIAQALVSECLAACVNILPGLTSIYRWQGKTERENEVLMLIKTRRDRYSDLESRLRFLHPYELPEIIAVPITTGLSEYLNWVDSHTLGSEDEKQTRREHDTP